MTPSPEFSRELLDQDSGRAVGVVIDEYRFERR
jgi:hypothetical protein